MTAAASDRSLGERLSLFADRRFKYLIVAPAILLLLFIGIFPLIYSVAVSFQNITMLEEDTSFHGLIHYGALFKDTRLWEALGHTLLITAVALPLELIFGLLMALLFLDRLPGRQVFIALLVLPTMIAPVVATKRSNAASPATAFTQAVSTNATVGLPLAILAG